MVVECYFEWQTIQSGRLNLISGWIHGTKGVLVGSLNEFHEHNGIISVITDLQ